MDIEKTFQIRDARTKNVIGVKDNDNILVPENGQVTDFVKNYNALSNYEMGMVAELYDAEAEKVDHFVILYAFKEYIEYPNTNMKVYRVLEETLSNLDVLEILHQYNEKKENKKSNTKI